MYTDFILGVAAGFAGAVSTITIIGILRSQKLKKIKNRRERRKESIYQDYEIPHFDPHNDRW